jgi:transcriptional regulator with XRE-family HTH domain
MAENNIRALRLQVGLRAADISRKTGVPPQSISRFENHVSRPSRQTASLIADAIGRQAREVFPDFDQLRDYPVVIRSTVDARAGR